MGKGEEELRKIWEFAEEKDEKEPVKEEKEEMKKRKITNKRTVIKREGRLLPDGFVLKRLIQNYGIPHRVLFRTCAFDQNFLLQFPFPCAMLRPSLYRNYATGWMTEEPGFFFLNRRDFSLLRNVHTGSETHPASHPTGIGSLSPV
jgi:hypothetical protein